MTNTTLLPVEDLSDILPVYRGTPIGDLLAYHNLDAPHAKYTTAPLLVGMCIDHRKRLRIPQNFAYVMRAAGARFEGLEFQISFAIGVGGVRAVAVIGHDQCGMVGLAARRSEMTAGLVKRAGWRQEQAESHFDENAPQFEIPDAEQTVRVQAESLSRQYPKVIVAPLMYRLESGMLYQLRDDADDGHR